MKEFSLYRCKTDDSITFLLDLGESDEESVVGYLKDGITKSYTKKYFDKNFVLEKFDYSNLDKHILQYITTVPELSPVLEQICRRLHPGGYFHVGDIVFGTENIGYYSQRDYDFRLIDYPMTITEIKRATDSSTAFIIGMNPNYEVYELVNKTLYMPMYLDRYSKIDAYACLRRYDLPY